MARYISVPTDVGGTRSPDPRTSPLQMSDSGTDDDRGGPPAPVDERPPGGSVRQRYPVGDDEPLDVAVTCALASMEGVDPTDLRPPLHDVVDLEALEHLVESAGPEVRATFTVEDYEVQVVDGGGEILIAAD